MRLSVRTFRRRETPNLVYIHLHNDFRLIKLKLKSQVQACAYLLKDLGYQSSIESRVVAAERVWLFLALECQDI